MLKNKYLLISFVIVFMVSVNFSQAEAQSLSKRANKLLELKSYKDALKSFQKIVSDDPENREARIKLAECYLACNYQEDATKELEKAALIKPLAGNEILLYATALREKGDYNKALRQFELLLGTDINIDNEIESCKFAIANEKVPSLFSINNCKINSGFSDFAVCNTNDDKVVFASFRNDVKRELIKKSGSVSDDSYNQLFISNFNKNNVLEGAKYLQSDLNYEMNQAPLSYSPNKDMVAFCKNNFVDGVRQNPKYQGNLSIYLAKIDENGNWNSIKAFPYNSQDGSSGYPSFSQDGKSLYFASTGYGSEGGYDIFKSDYENGQWSAPKSVSSTVNTIGNEIYPYEVDGVLYFASDTHPGFGGVDVFRAEGKGFNKIYNLGTGINSSKDDYGLIEDETKNGGFFVSNRNSGKGKEDIYQFSKKSATFEIIAVDGISNDPIPFAKVDFSDCSDTEYSADKNGKYSFEVLEDIDCTLKIKKEGYETGELYFSSKDKYQKRSVVINLIKKGSFLNGKVIDNDSGTPLSSTVVKATEIEGNQILEAITNAEGDYYLPLKANSTYNIRYSKVGYMDLNRNFSNQPDATLGDFKLFKNINNLTAVKKSEEVVAEKQSKKDIKSKEETVAPKSKEKTEQIKKKTEVKNTTSGFAIQIGSYTNDSELDLSKYDDLKKYGKLFTQPVENQLKLRVGNFSNKKEAESALENIKKLGYDNAFVVEQKNIELKKPGKSDVTEKGAKTETKKQDKDTENFYIRLITLKNPSSFDDEKIKNLGKIERRTKDDLNIFIIGTYKNLDDAKEKLEIIKKSGFENAIIVNDINGNLQPVK